MRLVLETDGKLSVYMGSSSVGQGVETIMAQIAADAMEMTYDRHHDLSRLHELCEGRLRRLSLALDRHGRLGDRCWAAEKLKADMIRETAALRFGCAADQDVVIEGERAGYQRQVHRFCRIVGYAAGGRSGLLQQEIHLGLRHAGRACRGRPRHRTRQGAGLMSVEDVGRMINPLTLHGQAIGSMVQGLAARFLST